MSAVEERLAAALHAEADRFPQPPETLPGLRRRIRRGQLTRAVSWLAGTAMVIGVAASAPVWLPGAARGPSPAGAAQSASSVWDWPAGGDLASNRQFVADNFSGMTRGGASHLLFAGHVPGGSAVIGLADVGGEPVLISGGNPGEGSAYYNPPLAGAQALPVSFPMFTDPTHPLAQPLVVLTAPGVTSVDYQSSGPWLPLSLHDGVAITGLPGTDLSRVLVRAYSGRKLSWEGPVIAQPETSGSPGQLSGRSHGTAWKTLAFPISGGVCLFTFVDDGFIGGCHPAGQLAYDAPTTPSADTAVTGVAPVSARYVLINADGASYRVPLHAMPGAPTLRIFTLVLPGSVPLIEVRAFNTQGQQIGSGETSTIGATGPPSPGPQCSTGSVPGTSTSIACGSVSVSGGRSSP
ncbi:MAG TPA: hypothetical protein VNG13_00345 [Mycobacteriales bacterium]|nr:hypothetical protein [Mycobacteriales bacterium]